MKRTAPIDGDMDLNPPILPQLQGCQNIRGYDIFCGLPFYFALQQQGFNVHLANYSFADIQNCSVGERLSPNLVDVRASENVISPYFPEYYLSQWFAQARGQQVPIWAFEKTEVQPLAEGYALLQQRLQFDAAVLVDGGVDSLVLGDEAESGRLVEDAISLAALRRLAPGPKARERGRQKASKRNERKRVQGRHRSRTLGASRRAACTRFKAGTIG